MADFTFTIPDDILKDVLDEFCATHGYSALIDNPLFIPGDERQPQLIANPVSDKDFLLQVVIRFIQNSVKIGITNKAVEVERKKVIAETDAKYVLTAKPSIVGNNEEPIEP